MHILFAKGSFSIWKHLGGNGSKERVSRQAGRKQVGNAFERPCLATVPKPKVGPPKC